MITLSVVAWILPCLSIAGQTEKQCPKDQRWGGEKCEWINLCRDGTPLRDGVCSEPQSNPEPVRRPHQPNPTVTPLSKGEPKTIKPEVTGKPIDVISIGPPRPARCPDGRSPVSGKCPPTVKACERQTIFRRGANDVRNVLFVGGDSASLFDRYLSDAKARSIEIDYENLTVFLYNAQGDREAIRAKMTLGRLFSGMTFPQVWKKTLKGVKAANFDDPEAEAAALDADLICGGLR